MGFIVVNFVLFTFFTKKKTGFHRSYAHQATGYQWVGGDNCIPCNYNIVLTFKNLYFFLTDFATI